MSELVVIFRTHSDVEASIVRGLLEVHGVRSLVTSGVSRSVFPLTVNELGEVRIAVNAADELEARQIIDSHRNDVPGGRVVRLRDEFETLQTAIDYRFRDRGLLEHAMTHTSRANEDVSGGSARQRVARVSRRRGARIRRSPTCCFASFPSSTKARSPRSRPAWSRPPAWRARPSG